MNWTILKTEKDYEMALARLNEIFDASSGSTEGEEAALLTILIEQYEELHYKMPDPDPVEAIKFMMEQTNLKPKDMIGILGNKASVSRILNRKRTLNLEMIRGLHNRFKIPYEVLMHTYPLKD
jgi:HTH-type transcriptional regulator / antitoxin HigA